MKKSLKRNIVVLLALCFICSNSLLMVKAEEVNEVNFQEEIKENNNNKNLEEKKESTEEGAIAIDEGNFPDAVFRKYLNERFTNGVITTSEINETTSIDVSGYGISSLNGIEYFTELKKLMCFDNNLTILNLSKNPELEELHCSRNQLISLDVSENSQLMELLCSNNQLTDLDVSNNPKLKGLGCFNNQLTSLDMSNNLELNGLGCHSNQLITLDVSKNTKLEELHCYDNQLTILDVRNSRELIYLYCNDNQLTTLDVRNNLNLVVLACNNNQLTTLDVRNNLNLEALACNNNQLTTLDVSNNIKLKLLNCNSNQLTYLNVPASVTIFSAQGQINSIAIKAGEAMYDLMNFGVGMDVTKISNLQGATLEGTKLKGLEIGKNVSYTYTCINGKTMDVVLEVKEKQKDPTPQTPPTTGDTTNTAVLFMMMGVASLILSVVFVRKRMEK